jgi:asparagine synthase (glutamine-hydrolysing)
MAMRRLEPGLDLRTFSYAAEDPAINEERWVDVVGEASRAVVSKVRPTPTELVADLDALIAAQDEPFGSTSIYAQHRVFRLARESGIKVMLDGQGADEMLAGYRSYLMPRLASLLRQGRLIRAGRFARQASAISGLSGKFLLAGAGGAIFPGVIGRGRLMPSFLRPAARRAGIADGAAQGAVNAAWFAERGAGQREPPAGNGHTRFLRKSLRETLVETSLPMLLRYEDRNSMAHSIESRVPFLTTALVEFVLSLPEEYLLAADGTSKSIFRRAMRGVVPDVILDRRDKIGFATPEKDWLTVLRPWVEGVLDGDAARAVPALNLAAIRREWDDVLAGRRPYSTKVWQWVNVIRWAERFGVEF